MASPCGGKLSSASETDEGHKLRLPLIRRPPCVRRRTPPSPLRGKALNKECGPRELRGPHRVVPFYFPYFVRAAPRTTLIIQGLDCVKPPIAPADEPEVVS